MIVSRGKMLLAFLGIYLVLGFLTGFGSSERKEWTIEEQQLLREAACIAGCFDNKSKLSRRWSGLSDMSKVDIFILLDNLFRWIIGDMCFVSFFQEWMKREREFRDLLLKFLRWLMQLLFYICGICRCSHLHNVDIFKKYLYTWFFWLFYGWFHAIIFFEGSLAIPISSRFYYCWYLPA